MLPWLEIRDGLQQRRMQTIAGCKQKSTNAMDPRMNERAIIIGCMALYALPSIPAGVDAGTAAAFADEKETTCSTRARRCKELFTVKKVGYSH